MPFHDARSRLLDRLERQEIDHWPRRDVYRKNWLEAGRVTAQQVRALLLRCRGGQHRESPHHFEPTTTVDEFFPRSHDGQWYIKVFFDDERGVATFMSVHPSGD